MADTETLSQEVSRKPRKVTVASSVDQDVAMILDNLAAAKRVSVATVIRVAIHTYVQGLGYGEVEELDLDGGESA